MIAAFLFFLAWGSYLNSLAYRLIHTHFFFRTRSFCPHCKQKIAWYDNIPVFSWLYLYGKCRSCNNSISKLYPFIEIITTLCLWLLWQQTPDLLCFISYFIFFSALIVTIRTDLEHLLISRFVTTYLIPCGILCAAYHALPISVFSSITGIIFGYVLLWSANVVHKKIMGHDGLGQGDLELLACIGAFTGPLGCWVALSIGSITGVLLTTVYMAAYHTTIKKIPFGAYLAGGAIIFTLYQNFFTSYFIIS